MKARFLFGLKVCLALFVFFLVIDLLAIFAPPVAAIKALVLSPLAGIQSVTGFDLASMFGKKSG